MSHTYNEKLIEALSRRFAEVSKRLNADMDTDLYSTIASILYDKPYESCLDLGENQDLRYSVKHCIVPVVLEFGGIHSEDVRRMASESE